MTFAHLHTHSEYSIADGLAHTPALVESAVAHGFTAVALTDLNNLFGTVSFYQSAVKRGLKPIIGCELSLDFSLGERDGECSVVLLCMNRQGYKNLMCLLTLCYSHAGRDGPKARYEWIVQHSDGLIALSGGKRGDLGHCLLESHGKKQREVIDFWKEHFPERYYVEVFRTARRHDDDYSRLALDTALAENLPVVATNDVCFLEKKHFDAHEAKVCITQGFMLADEARPEVHSAEQYLKGDAQMKALFKDVPQAIENANEIVRRCTLKLDFGKVQLPKFPLPEGVGARQHLVEVADQALRDYLKTAAPGNISADDYHARLRSELGIIGEMDYAGYFLIVADFVGWARNNDIAVGPGRGSGAGSLVAFMLGITEIDPLPHDLLFERFLNPERVSMPDFDIDFCMDNRDRVVSYVIERYGADKVSQIITFDKMAARAAVRDVGRVQGKSYNFVDEVAKLIPRDLNITLEKALKNSPELKERYENEDEVTALINASMAVEGVVRNPGRHAGGLVIAPGPLTDYMPLYREAGKQNMLTQFDMKGVEQIGLVKFDFLGLRTLTLIDRSFRQISEQTGKPIKASDLPLDDEETYKLLQSGDTTAVFQLESESIREMIKGMKPDKFDEIVVLIALHRPGPLKSEMDKQYIQRKHGQASVEYPHPKLESILKPTYGVIVYQEQVMEIARELAGYSLGKADLLRRAMGKKLKQEMAEQSNEFIEGAVKLGVKRSIAVSIFKDIEKFAEYGFNKSHSVAYALLTYYTAWLKTHYPAVFMATAMSCEMEDKDRVESLIHASRNLGLKVLLPNVNQGGWDFTVSDDDSGIYYGLSAIRHVGKLSAVEIIKEREENGKFKSLHDFCQRVVPLEVKKNLIEMLVKVGALDDIGARAEMLAVVEYEYELAEQSFQDASTGQTNLLGDLSENTEPDLSARINGAAESYSRIALLAFELENLGAYLSAHPLTLYQREVEQILHRVEQTVAATNGKQKMRYFSGVCTKTMRKKAGSGYGVFFILDDGRNRHEFAMFGDAYNTMKDKLSGNDILFVKAKCYYDAKRKIERWRAQELVSMKEIRQKRAKNIQLAVDLAHSDGDFAGAIRGTIKPFLSPQGCHLKFVMKTGGSSIRMKLGPDWKIRPCEALLTKLRQVQGVSRIDVLY